MTPQAVEAPPVAHRASRLIRIELAACVSSQESGRVGGRLQLSALHVAELATVRWIDLVMAHQAIRHLRQSAPIRPVGNLQPAMARLAGILRVELYPQLRARRCQVGLLIDRRDRKSTRLNSSHLGISYAVFCLKKKKKLGQSVLDALALASQERPVARGRLL